MPRYDEPTEEARVVIARWLRSWTDVSTSLSKADELLAELEKARYSVVADRWMEGG